MRKLLAYGLIGFGLYKVLQGYRSINAYKSLSTKVIGLRDVNVVGLSHVNFKVDLQLFNPTPMPVELDNTGVLRVKLINLLTQSNDHIATLTPENITLSIAPRSSAVIRNVPAIASPSHLVQNILTAGAFSDIKTELVIEAAGQVFVLES